MSNASESGNSSGTTYSAITQGQVVITDKTGQQTLTGVSAEQTLAALNRNTKDANNAAAQIDAAAMQKEVDANKAIKDATVSLAMTYTDDAYKALFSAVQFYNVSCKGAQSACINDAKQVQQTAISFAEAVAGSGNSAVNGIMNTDVRAGQLAYQNTPLNADGTKPDSVVLMYIPKTATSFGDVLVTGYEKLLAPYLGYSTADTTLASYLQARGTAPDDLVAHSRGTIVVRNAFDILASDGFKNDAIKVTAVGLAVTPSQLTDSVVKVIGKAKSDNVVSVYMKNDPVSVLAGFNNGSIWQSILEFPNVSAKDNSAHSCYGTGAVGCVTIASPFAGGPVGTNQNNSNVVIYNGYKPKQVKEN